MQQRLASTHPRPAPYSCPKEQITLLGERGSKMQLQALEEITLRKTFLMGQAVYSGRLSCLGKG